jgi:ribosome-associated protein
VINIQDLVSALEDKKAENIVVIDLQNAFVDHMIVATASSSRQLLTLAEAIVAYAKQQGILPIVDGAQPADWVVVDVGDTLIHLFKSEARSYYNIEKMWGHDAQPTEA